MCFGGGNKNVSVIEVASIGADGDDDGKGAGRDGNRDDGMGYDLKLQVSKRSLP